MSPSRAAGVMLHASCEREKCAYNTHTQPCNHYKVFYSRGLLSCTMKTFYHVATQVLGTSQFIDCLVQFSSAIKSQGGEGLRMAQNITHQIIVL